MIFPDVAAAEVEMIPSECHYADQTASGEIIFLFPFFFSRSRKAGLVRENCYFSEGKLYPRVRSRAKYWNSRTTTVGSENPTQCVVVFDFFFLFPFHFPSYLGGWRGGEEIFRIAICNCDLVFASRKLMNFLIYFEGAVISNIFWDGRYAELSKSIFLFYVN